MFYTCICELPFFTQLEINDKDALIKELENNNRDLQTKNLELMDLRKNLKQLMKLKQKNMMNYLNM